jgi:hypothetical protein
MKHKLKNTIPLHRRYRKFDSGIGSMRWHIEVPASDLPGFDGDLSDAANVGFTNEEEFKREKNRKADDVNTI